MAKAYVKPVVTKWGEPRGVTGATMEDGTRYLAARNGSFEVERGDHVAAMKADPNNADLIVFGSYTPRGVKGGRMCPQCGFSGWAWQTVCPRDGHETVEWSDDGSTED